MTTIQTVIADKLEALHEATQARVDATQAEARAAVDVMVTSIQSACLSARYIEFDLKEITGAVGFGRCYGDNGECEATDASRAFWYRTAEGRTLREIRRCLKRYLAREIYRRLNTAAQNELATT